MLLGWARPGHNFPYIFGRTKTVDVIDPPRELELFQKAVCAAVSLLLSMAMSTHLLYSVLVRETIPTDRPTRSSVRPTIQPGYLPPSSSPTVLLPNSIMRFFFSSAGRPCGHAVQHTVKVGGLVAVGRRPPTNRVVLACGGGGAAHSLADRRGGRQGGKAPSKNSSEAIFMQDS